MRHDAGFAASARESPPAGPLAGIQERVTSGKVTWAGPLVLLVGRTFLLAVGQSLVAGLYFVRGDPSPWTAAAPWWSVFWTVADLGCLLLLVGLTRREGLRITDLFGRIRLRWGHDVLLGLGLWLLIFPAFLLAGPLASGVSEASLRRPQALADARAVQRRLRGGPCEERSPLGRPSTVACATAGQTGRAGGRGPDEDPASLRSCRARGWGGRRTPNRPTERGVRAPWKRSRVQRLLRRGHRERRRHRME